MRVRVLRSFGLAGRFVEPGEILDVPPRQALEMVDGYHDCAYVDDTPPPPSAMVVSADPEIISRDPQAVATLAGKRRR